MKKSSEIINSPVISIQEGLQLGTVRELVVNAEKKSVEFLLVERENPSKEGEILAIPFHETVGVGEYAVTIEDQRMMLDLSKMNIAGNLLDNRVHIIDEKVITRKGKLLGTISEYQVDPENGSITIIELIASDQSQQELPLETIVSFGRQVVIVSDEAEGMLKTKKETAVTGVETGKTPAAEGDVLLEQMRSGSFAEEQEDMPEATKGSSVAMFIARQKTFLLGKELKGDLKGEAGDVIAAAGTIITPDIFEKAQAVGRQKVIELTMLTE